MPVDSLSQSVETPALETCINAALINNPDYRRNSNNWYFNSRTLVTSRH